jgi:hypothetical protein
MKTKIKSLILICALGLVGVFNAHALSNYNTSSVAGMLEEQNLRFENLNSAEFVFDANAEIDYLKEAQMVTKWVADREEAKTIHTLIHKRMFGSSKERFSFAGKTKEFFFNAYAKIDYQKEAQLLTKWAADNEEARVVKNLIEEGKLEENR